MAEKKPIMCLFLFIVTDICIKQIYSWLYALAQTPKKKRITMSYVAGNHVTMCGELYAYQ
jgi:hypothetical protein